MSVLDNALQAMFDMARKSKAWKNASPTSNFAAQKIAVDLSDCSEVGIEYAYSGAGNTSYFSRIRIGGSASIICWYQLSSSGNTMGQFNRAVNVDTAGVDFGDAFGKSTSTGVEATTNNGRVIPLAIYKLGGQ